MNKNEQDQFGTKSSAQDAASDLDGLSLPLSPAQLGVYFDHLNDTTGIRYNIGQVTTIAGDLDVELFRSAAARLVAQTPALNMAIVLIDDMPRQVSVSDRAVEVSFHDLRDTPDPQAARAELVHYLTFTPFDLARDPLFRWALIKVKDGETDWVQIYHHIIADGWSFQRLVAQLSAGYTSLLADGYSRVVPEVEPYADHIAEEIAYQESAVAVRDGTYWRDLLSDYTCAKPFEERHVWSKDVPFIRHRVVLEGAVLEGMTRLAKAHGTTSGQVVTAAIAVMEALWSQSDDIVLGTPLLGRFGAMARSVVSMSNNLGHLRITDIWSNSIGSLLEDIKSQQSAGLRRQRYRYEDLKRDLFETGTSAMLARVNINQMPFGYDVSFGELSGKTTNLSNGPVDGLSVALYPQSDERLIMDFNGNASAFDLEAVRHMGEQVLHILDQFRDLGSERVLGSLRLASDIEVECLSGFNATSCAVEVGVLPDLLSDRAVLDIGSPAVVFGDGALSYGELEARSNALGRYLIGLGVGPDAVVGIALPRSFEMVIALVGVLKAGGAYLPLDPEYPEDRLRYMLGDSGADVVISRSDVLERLGLGGIDTDTDTLPNTSTDSFVIPTHILCVDDAGLSAALADQETTRISNAERVAPLRPEHLAYVIYTSGSTGRPKGVGNTHGGAINLIAAQEQGFDIKPGDRVLQFAAQSFDASISEVFTACLTRGTLVLPDNEVRQSVEALTDLIATQNVTHATLPPALAGLIPTGSLSNLRTLVVAGEACTPDIISRFAGGLRLINAYGPTETTVCAALTAPLDADCDSVGTAPIGSPIWNTQVHVLSGSLQIVPVGVWGEMYISGAGLARGYVGRSDLTSERFIACPFGAAGSRMYRTGDLGRWRSDGVLEFGGRSDDQVKLRGFRIEPGEIEAALERLEGVGQAAVVVREIAGEARLVGYVTPQGDTDSNTDVTTDSTTSVLEASVLRAGLSAELPEYMVPSAFVVLGSFPLSPSGKLDRRGLPAPEITGVSEYEAPVTPDEALLCRLFGELTGAARVSATESFFALGGDSISAIRLVSHARRGGLYLEVRDVFRYPDPRGLASVGVKVAAVVERLPEVGPLRATPVAQWFLEEAGLIDRFNQAVSVRPAADIDPVVIETALRSLIKRHGALRLRYACSSGLEILSPEAAPQFSLDLLDEGLGEAAASAVLSSASEGLSPSEGRMVVGVWNAARRELLLVIHHLSIDGVSWRVLLEELALLCAGETLPSLGHGLQDWMGYLTSEAARPERIGELEYWQDQTRAQYCLPLDGVVPETENTLGNAAYHSYVLDAQHTRLVLEAPSVYRAEINDLLIAALGMALGRWSKEAGRDVGSVVIDLEGHGREPGASGLDLTQTIGWFTSLYPVRLDLDHIDIADAFAGGDGAGHVLMRSKEVLHSIPDKGLGYGVLERLNAETGLQLRAQSGAPIVFNYLGSFEQVLEHGWQLCESGLVGVEQDSGQRRQHLIDVNAILTASGAMQVGWSYPVDMIDAGVIARVAEYFGDALIALSTHCHARPLAQRWSLVDLEAGVRNRITALELGELEVLYPDMERVVALTPLQQGLVFESIALPVGAMDPYHVNLAFELAGDVDPDRVTASWRSIVQRHEILRLGLPGSVQGQGVGVIRGLSHFDFRVITASETVVLEDVLEADRREGFDLCSAPLFRGRLILRGSLAPWLVISNHHVVMDGWSLSVLMKDLLDSYAGVGLGAHLAWWERAEEIALRPLDTAQAYWRSYLSECDGPCVLDLPVSGEAGSGFGEVKEVLSEALTADLLRFGRRVGITPAIVVQGAYMLVVRQLAGSNQVMIGTTRSGRSGIDPREDSGVGLYINTLPVYSEVKDNLSVGDWLSGLQQDQAEQGSYEHLALNDVQRLVPGGESGSGLFEAMYVFENYPERASSAQGAGALQARLISAFDATQYPLALQAFGAGELGLRLTYDRGRFGQEAAGHVMQQVLHILDQFRDLGSERVLGSLRLASEIEVECLSGFNATSCAVEVGVLPDLLSDRAVLDVGSPAVVFGDDALSYGELEARSNALGRYLIGLGVGPDAVVGIALPRSFEMVIALVGVLKAGGAYLPLDPEYPEDRLCYMLGDSGADVVISRSDVLERLGLGGIETNTLLDTNTDTLPNTNTSTDASVIPTHILCVDDAGLSAALADQETARISNAERVAPLRPDHLAYVIYTSGSTGRPKGVGNTHSGAINLVAAQEQGFDIKPGDRTLQFAAQSFDASIWEIFNTVLNEGTLVLPDNEVRQSVEALTDLIATQNVTHATLPPALAGLIPTGSLSNLRTLVVAGEACTPDIISRFAGGLRLINAYGPTEATVCAAMTAPLDADCDSVGTAPIGSPIWNTQVHVLSGSLQIVPVGVWGEMYISGAGLARGYVGRSDLTSERFIACPFGAAGSRMYRTGDLGRWRSDGVLEFGGRSDDQVKLRGFRIEPGEIEAALERLEGVGQAAVVVREIAGEARLVGYVTPQGDTDSNTDVTTDSTTSVLEASVLRAGLSTELPEYMVPSAFVVLGSFPLSPSGKLDRRGLPAPEITGVSEYEAPVTPDEALLCRLFGELTGAARVSVTESFFALGGDSISAIRLVSHARRGGLYLEVRDVFRYPDPRGLASVGVKVAAVVERLPEVGPLRATPVAQWFLEEAGLIDRFNQAVSVRPAADIDPVVIETALRSLIKRHGALRLRYACSSGLEILSPEAAPQFSLDLLDEGLGEAAASAVLSSASEGLSPSEGRMVVGVWNAARRELLLVIHHLSIDGVSWRVLLEELALLCAGETLPSLGHGLQDWMGYLTSEAARPERIGELEYWQDQTRAQYCLPLDGVVPETENTLGNAAYHSYVLDAQHTRLVLEAPSVYRAEINDLLIAALGMALGRWSKEAGRDVGSVVIDLEGHGREPGASGLDLTQTIGWFTSLYPVRLDLDHIDIADAFAGGDSAGHVLMRSKEVLHSIPDKGLGYGVLERLNAETGLQLRAQSGAPIVFNYLGSFEQVLEHGWQLCESGLVGVEQDSGQRRQHLIDVNAILTASGAMQVGWSYPVDMIDAGVIARVAEYFGDALIALSTHCHARPLAQRWSLVDLEAGVRNRITALELGELEVLYPDMERVVALTPLQQGLVFESIALPVGAMDPYHVNLAFELAGDVDPDRVTASWRSIVQRHEILRLGLPGSVQGQGVGVIRGLSHFDFRVITASETVVLEDVLEADRREGFDLCSAPLFRGRLILRGSLAPWLVISNHHVVMDGWSLSVLMKDLLDSYAGVGLGAHLAWWERAEEIALRPLDTAQAYWRSYLSECDGPCVLDLPVSGEAGSGFGEVKEVLSEALTADLLRFGRRVGITPAIVVQGAYMLVVRQLAGSNQVMIGTTRSGRSGIDPREDSGVGLYINTLPVYSEVKDNLSVGDWLSGLQQDQAEQGIYEHLALNDVQRLVPGGESGSGLFEAMYVFENYPERASSAQGVGALQARLISAFDATQYPLALQAFGAGELGLRLTYDRGRFGQEAAGHVMQQVLHILDQFRDLGSERVLGSLRLASDIEVECLSGFNATSCAVDVGVLPDLLSDRAVLDAGSPAVVFGDDALSYGELEARSNALGRYLIGLGVGPDAVVGIALPRSFEMVIALVGVLKAGGAYLPLDPDYPEDRLRYMLDDSGADVVISRSDVLERLGLGGIDTNTDADTDTDILPNTSTDPSTDPSVIPTHILCVDDAGLSAALADQETTRISNAERVAPLRPDHLAYVIYTSGSTGRPKGVGMPHCGLGNLLSWHMGEHPEQKDTIYRTPVGFDVGVQELWSTLLLGARLIIVPHDAQKNMTVLDHLPQTTELTLLAPQSVLEMLAEEAVHSDKTVRFAQIIQAGEAFRLTDSIRPLLSQTSLLLNHYGPTESHVVTSYKARMTHCDKILPIGSPIWNTQVHVLSGSLQIVPVGVWGEMYISGAGLARGYVGRSDLTSERFIACPFGGAGSRMYRTGDLGRWRSDGVLEFGGRSDDQVKLRGFRIEPGEIEAALERLEGVGQAAVVVREIAGEARLVGYVTPRSEIDSNTDVTTDSTASLLEPSVLRAGLSAELPEYMVPSAFVVLGSFPLSPSGKLDRRGLPAPEITGVSEYEAPVTPDEALLCRLFGELTGAARVSVTESFFALGGHSLLVMRLVARVRTERGVELPLRSVFAHPSARALAVALSQAGSTRLGAVIAGSGFDDEGGAVLSLGQERLWSLSQLEAVPSGQYNIPIGLRLTGALDVGALGAALECLVDRHAVLRTVIDAPDGIACGRVLPRGSFGSVLEEVDLRGSGGVPEREAEALSVLLAFARRPFDLACDVRLRALLVHVGPEEALLGLVADHGSFDGSSFAVFSAELSALYDAARSEFAGDLGSALAPLEWQFGDWAAWQRGWLDAGGLEAGLEYWEDHLSGAPHILELPTDYVRRADRARIAGYHDVVITPEVRSGLEALALSHGTTLYGVLLAGLGFVLSGLTRQDEVVIGSPSAGRVQEGSEALLGFFVNTLALRLAPGIASDLGDYLEQVGGTVRDGLEHESAPFEQVVERVGVERSLSHAPVFQVMFAWQSQGGGSLGLGDLDIAGIDLPLGQAKFDLSVSLAPDADGSIRGVLEYDGDLFTSVTISRWCDVLGSVLGQFANAAHAAGLCSLGSLRLASDIEVECLSGFNATSCAVEVGVLPDLLSDRAVLDVGSPAVVFGDGSLSYGELEARSNALGRYLIGLGVGPDAVVGIALPRSFEMVIALVGVLKAGGAYLPLDPEYPEDRLRYMLGDSGADVVISRSDVLERLGLGGIDTDTDADTDTLLDKNTDTLPNTSTDASVIPTHILCVDDADLSAALADQETARISNAERVAPLRPDHLAYVIYTSGSTGRPKGVGNTHENVWRLLNQTEEWFNFGSDDAWTLFHSYAFDFSVWELWGAFAYGGRLVIVPDDARHSPDALLDLLVKEQVTVLNQTPTVFYNLCEVLETRGDGVDLSHLKTIVFGGEALDPGKLLRWYRLGHECQLVNMYGITEISVHATYFEYNEHAAAFFKNGQIGRPIPDLSIHVLSGSLQIVPVGVWGEMYISGAGLARGYVGRSDLTSERFIACPFGGAGSRMYRTGDLGRWRSDGVLEFGGRSDDQVKLRGFRIEPGEIEAALERLEGVGQAAVVVREIAGEARLVGYVTPQSEIDSETDSEIDSTASLLEPSVLRAGLSAELPEYMVPSAFVVLGSFPLSPSGKLDRRGLPAPEITGVSEYEAPVTPDEALLCRLFGELTGAARVSATESFFALGGHSLLVMRLVARVRAERGVELPLRSVFAHPSARALAVALSQAGSTRLGAVIAGSGFDDEGGAVLSLGQERLWSLSQLEAVPSGQYNIPIGLRLTGALDVGALGAALECLVDRHAVLRTVIDAPDGIACGRVLPRGSFGSVLEEVDLRGSGGVPEREAEALSVLLAFARRPFDLACDVRLRALLVHVGPEEALLGLVADHGSFDGSSFAVFSAELSALYDAARSEFAGDLGSALAPLEWQFGDWAAWQRGWLDAGCLEAGLEYWEDHLSGAPHILELPTDYVRRADRARIAGYHDVVITPEVRSGLEALALSHGTTLYGVLLAGLGFVLSGLTRQDEVVIGSPSAGRVQEGSEALLGFFVNTLALRLAPGIASDLGDYLEQVGGTVRDGLEHESAPFEQVVERVGVERSLSHAPVFQVMFAWQSQGGGSLGLGDLDIAGIDLPLGQAKFDLSVSLAPDADGSIRGVLEYDGDLFTSVTISRWCDVLGSVLGQFANAAHAAGLCSLGSLRLASDIEVECLSGFNATSCAVEVGVLPDLLSDRAVLDVGSPAVVFGDGSLSYGELEARSNALGRYLIGLGVGPDAVVGIALPRSFEMVIALVGVLKAGGAYLPLDPEYPEDRLRYMLGDSGADVVISRSDVLERLGLGGIETNTLLDTNTDTLPNTNTSTDASVIPTHILCVDDAGLSAALADQETTRISNAERVAPLRPEHLAYVIYTSGSTGRPKGVGNTHGGAINLIIAQEQGFDIKPGDRVLQFAAQSFDASISEVFTACLTRGTLVLPDNEVRQSVEALTDLIATQNVTHATLPPALAGLIPTGSLSNLRTLVVAGEACTPDIISRFAGGLRLINAYGPTETTVCAALTAPLDADCDGTGTPPIGSPIWNTQIHVLSGSLQIVPVGVWGEMYISGAGLARGYVGRSDLTSERFIACPFGAAGSRMYRTGDLGRWRSDGVLEFGGRSDDQVKLRGFRIEPGEIEAALERLEGVGQAAVVVREIAGEARLVGYVTPQGDTDSNTDVTTDSTTSVLEASVLRAGLSTELPEYMVPSAFVVLGSFPLSPSGKLDRRGLPAPEITGVSEYEAPVTPDEALLCRLFGELTGAARVSVTESFFALGGHSLLVMRLVARVRAERGVELPLRSVFAHPSARALAVALSQVHTYDPILPIRANGTERPLFCVHPATGSSTVFANLTNELPEDIPVYGMQAKHLSASETGHTSLYEMAECYVEAVQRVQPQGPYRLLGWSLGGAIVQEMVAQLEAQGEIVDVALLLDSSLSGDDMPDVEQGDETELLSNIVEEELGLSSKGMSHMALKEVLLLEVKRTGLMPQAAEITDLNGIIAGMHQASALMAEWPGCSQLSAPITFVRASDNERTDLSERLSEVTQGKVKIVSLSSTHFRMGNHENSRELALLVKDALKVD